MTERASATAAAQRRAQRRQAMYDELLGCAREALREGRPLSLRAIAAEMGLTAPALYRYVDSLAALEAALADAIHQDVLAALEEAAQRWPEDRPGLRLYASIGTLRRWALSMPEEFRLVFGKPPQGWNSHLAEDALPRAIQFYAHFMNPLMALREGGHIREVPPEQLPAAIQSEAERFLGRWADSELFARASPSLWWDGLRDWVVLCGVLRMEVDGLVPQSAVADASIFRDMLVSIGLRLGAEEADLRNAIAEAFVSA